MSDDKIWVKLSCIYGGYKWNCAGTDSTFEIPLSDYKRNKQVTCSYGHTMPAQSFVVVGKTDFN